MSDAHLDELSEQGYTIVADAIEPELVDALNDDLLRLERELGVTPSANDFEGHHTTRRGRARPWLPRVVVVVDRH